MSNGEAARLSAVASFRANESGFLWEPSPVVVVISGPSGAGKDSVIRRLQERHGAMHFVVTATSRPPRPGEIAGRDYHFFSREEFAERVARGEFLEHALVYGDYKGVPRWEITDALASGQDVVMRVDVQGARTLRRVLPEAVFVFIMAESEEEHLRRLHGRGSEDERSLAARRDRLWQEIGHLHEFDYVVINRRDGLDQAADDVSSIILAEKLRVRRTVPGADGQPVAGRRGAGECHG